MIGKPYKPTLLESVIYAWFDKPEGKGQLIKAYEVMEECKPSPNDSDFEQWEATVTDEAYMFELALPMARQYYLLWFRLKTFQFKQRAYEELADLLPSWSEEIRIFLQAKVAEALANTFLDSPITIRPQIKPRSPNLAA